MSHPGYYFNKKLSATSVSEKHFFRMCVIFHCGSGSSCIFQQGSWCRKIQALTTKLIKSIIMFNLQLCFKIQMFLQKGAKWMQVLIRIQGKMNAYLYGPGSEPKNWNQQTFSWLVYSLSFFWLKLFKVSAFPPFLGKLSGWQEIEMWRGYWPPATVVKQQRIDC